MLAAGGDSQTLGCATFAGHLLSVRAADRTAVIPRDATQTLGRAAGLSFLGLGLGAFFVALFAGLAGFEGDAADPAWLDLLANLAVLLSFVLACAVASTFVFWLIVRPDLHRSWQAAGKTRTHGE